MAGEVTLVAPSMPATAYFVVRNSSGQYWYTVTPAFEAYNAAHWADYDVALVQDGASQNYTGTFPSAITTGVYQLSAYAQAGGSPAVGDVYLGGKSDFQWSGTAIVSLDSRVKPSDTVARVTVTDAVTGAVGSVTGAVGSVTGNVGGNVTGSVGSVVGAVGSVTGNVGGNVVGSVASVTGNVATLAGAATVVLTDGSLTTAKLGTFALAKTTNITGFNDLSAAQVNAECDTAIADAALATAANLATVLADTNELQTDWTNGGRLDLILDGILDDTGTTGVVLATSAIGSNQLTTGAKTDLADAFLNRVMPGSITEDSTAYYLKYGPYVAFASTVTGTPSTTVVQVTGTGVTVDNYWNDCLLVIQDADGHRQSKPILTYDYNTVGPTYTFTVDEAFASAPVAGDVAFVVLTHIHPVSQIQSGLSTFDASTDTVTLGDTAHGGSSATLELAAVQVNGAVSIGDALTLTGGITLGTKPAATYADGTYSYLGVVRGDGSTLPTATAVATAQSDLDKLTGADGATLATLQPNYAPAVAGSQMDLVNAPNATAITAIQAGLATPTNITAGTITTVTNLTNAPTAGDFTATMKTSLNAATPAVTVSDKTGFSLAATGLDSISATAAAGVPTTFASKLMWLVQRFLGKATKTDTEIKVYADNGTTVLTTQTATDDGTTETQGAAT
jgi:hypothetical protein